MPSYRSLCCAVGLATGLVLSGCSALKSYKPDIPDAASIPRCEPERSDDAERSGAVDARCSEFASEAAAAYTLHFVEFDDQGWVFDDEQAQIDSAIEKIKLRLRAGKRLRLFVYVHGWRHFAKYDDENVRDFRIFLSETHAAAGCGPADLAAARTDSRSSLQTSLDRCAKGGAADEEIVGIYVGWRGLPIPDGTPLTYLTFWDRKRTADRIAQGSVRELFGRLKALAGAFAEAAPAPQRGSAAQTRQPSRLHTYVIGHSFGASIAFRALSQSIIDSFDHDLDGELGTVTRFVDMVVLINPAIEASRFEPVRSAAMKRVAYCRRANPATPAVCDQPPYQSPVLAVFTSEGDAATRDFFPIGARLSNIFETVRNDRQATAMNSAVGWDDHFKTHDLRVAPAGCEGVPERSPHRLDADGVDRLDPPGWGWCLSDGALLRHLPMSAERPTYNGPFWVVRVSDGIVRNHGDIWNPKFRAVLLRVLADQQASANLR